MSCSVATQHVSGRFFSALARKSFSFYSFPLFSFFLIFFSFFNLLYVRVAFAVPVWPFGLSPPHLSWDVTQGEKKKLVFALEMSTEKQFN